MPTKSEAFVQEFVLSFGFLGGLFTYVGVDPEEEAIRALLKIVIASPILVTLVVILISVCTTGAGILGTYAAAGKLGLCIVGIAWISGFIISIGGNFTVVGAFLLMGAYLLGPYAYDYHQKNKG
jgi:hypothetical protein